MIGTNRDLKSIQHILDYRITELKQFASRGPGAAWVSLQLAALGRERIAVSAILANRRIEATKKIVDLSRWFSGNGALSGGPVSRARAGDA
jgi:hypothetical protein